MAVSLGSGKKKSLNNDLNLTAFVDLLSTLICFLLISSVWITVASMDLKQSYGTDSTTPREAAELDIEMSGKTSAQVLLKKNGSVVHKSAVTGESQELFMAELATVAKGLKTFPGLKGVTIQSVLVTPHSAITHGDMVSVLDKMRTEGFANIGIKPDTEGR